MLIDLIGLFWNAPTQGSCRLLTAQWCESVPVPPFSFHFGGSIQQITCDTQLDHGTGSVLGDFAHLSASVSAENMIKVGDAKLWCLVG